MPKNGINITFSGGAARVGNVVQGNYVDNSISAGINNESVNLVFENGISEIEKLTAASNNVGRFADIENQLLKLKQDILNSNPKQNKSIGDKAKEIYDSYGWAAKPLKEMFEALNIAW